ncbi:MAG: TIGR01777 family oxidoreductase [Desulfocapsaceae bacterium]|nr:TIGR01777 family oxidoreductase [Desulfocapsaceae bacterium]
MVDQESFRFRSCFPCGVKELYDWHARPGALERLIPPWEKTTVVRKKGGLDPGGEVEMLMHAGPFPFRWHAHHVENTPGTMFRDIQHRGPFSNWSHTHHFQEGSNCAFLEDNIEYKLPFHAYIPPAVKKHVEDTLHRTFEHRRRVLTADLKLHNKLMTRPMKILISGASGVLGRALQPLLTTGGHEVWKLVRRQPDREQNELFWNPQTGEIDELPAFDAVVHLAGEYIGLGRWTPEKKKIILESRTKGTRLLAATIAGHPDPPAVFLSASAIGYYGDTQSAWVEEGSPSGNDFISEVCRLWEQSAAPAEQAGIRTVLMRIGVSISPGGGALERLLSTSPLGLIRSFGSGKQYISWISLDDTISAIYHAMCTDALEGPLNICAPAPVTNKVFMQILAKATGRPLLFSVPTTLLKAIYGQMASEILLSGCRTSCRKLQDSGFVFRHATLDEALTNMLGKFHSEKKHTEWEKIE